MITSHHDGHGLAESIVITQDAPGPGGASHWYEFYNGEHSAGFVQFQKGPRNEPGSTPGVIENAVLAVVVDRLAAFQAGEFACRENALALTKIQEAMHWIRHRADDRAQRGTLGTYQK